jgi:hypothetical protein
MLGRTAVEHQTAPPNFLKAKYAKTPTDSEAMAAERKKWM